MEFHSPLLSPGSLLATLLLVIFSLWRRKLTPPAVLAATLTALLHISSPSSLPFQSLILFFLLGTAATRIGHRAKAHLTASATGGSGAEGPRNAVQVLANSGAADVFLALALWRGGGARVVDLGVAAAYAAAAADTLSSELGILGGEPRLITTWERVARGTNGGVTLLGLAAGAVGAAALAGLDWWHYRDGTRVVVVVMLGVAGTVLDSLLGAVGQITVLNDRGKVVEGQNGRRVLVGKGVSRKARGRDWLNNNGVNFTMTLAIGVLGLLAAGLV